MTMRGCQALTNSQAPVKLGEEAQLHFYAEPKT